MKRQLFLLLAALTMLPIGAQIKGNSIVVTVEPDHQDWNYRVGETAKFTVEVRRSGTLVSDVSIDYTTGPEMYQDAPKTVTLKDGTLKLTGKMASPGFYRVDVTAHVGGKDYRGACAAAFSPEKLQPTTVMPKDFNEYWQNAIKQARYVDLNPTNVVRRMSTSMRYRFRICSGTGARMVSSVYPSRKASIQPCCAFLERACVPMRVMCIRLLRGLLPLR